MAGVFEEAVRLGGTITGEHGVGLTLGSSSRCAVRPRIAAMRAVKAALDRRGS